MLLFLLILLIAVPVAEIALFIEVGGAIGIGPTLGIVVLTAIAGSILLRHQGLATLLKANESLSRGHFPMREVFDGLCLLFAGALLLTPGFFTDACGMALFMPPVRATLSRFALRYLQASGRIETWSTVNGGRNGGRGGEGGDHDHDGENTARHDRQTTIEGEFSDISDDDISDDDKKINHQNRPGGSNQP